MSEKKTGTTSNNFGGKGWIMILYSALVFFIPTAMGSVWQMAVNYWGPAYGWDSAAVLSMVTVGGIATVVGAFLVRGLTSKFSVKTLSIVWGIVFTASIALIGFVKEFWMVSVLITVISFTGSNWCYNLNPIIIANWFPRKKGVVMGIATIGIPAAAGLTTVIYNWSVNTFGMELAFMPYVALCALALLILVFWVKENPEEAGFNPDNDNTITKEEVAKMFEEGQKIKANSPWTVKRTLATKEVWVIALAMGVQLLFAGGIMSQMIPRLLELGNSVDKAISMMLFSAICACVGSYIMGFVDTKLGTRRAIQIVYIISVAAMLLNLTGNSIAVYASLVLVGCVVGGASNFSASLCASYWGRFNFASSYGIIQPIIQIIGAFAGVYMAQVAAHFGGYSASYIGLIILSIIGLVAFSLIKDGSFVQRREAQFESEDKKVKAE